MSDPFWSTACLDAEGKPDWERRIVAGEPLITFAPLYPEEAERALAIFKSLKLTDVRGQPTMGEACRPWVFQFVAAIFGAYDAETGRQLIRYFLLLIAKKNSKSTIAAAIMLTALLLNWRPSGEFGILAPTKEIANNAFTPARDMIRADAKLSDILHIKENERTITHRDTKATLRVIAADSDTVGGKKFIGLLVDELWLFGARANADAMLQEAEGGLTSNQEGFVIYLSTQSDKPPTGIFAQKLDDFRDIRDGKVIDPESLPCIYEFPEPMIKSGAYTDPENFYIPNPNLGASVDPEYLVRRRRKADRAGKASLITWDAKHLNIQVGKAMRADGWAGAPYWDLGVDHSLKSIDALLALSDVATCGVDGGGLDDMLGLGVIGREKRTMHWLGWTHGLISTIGVLRRQANATDYLRFLKEGTLTIFRFGPETEDERKATGAVAELIQAAKPLLVGPKILPADIQYVVDLVKKIRDRGLLAQVGVDAAGIGAIVDALGTIDITQDAEKLDAVRQGIGLMGAMKTVERKLADRTFRHGGSALMDYCVSNVKIIPTRTAMMMARDEAGYGKIDPFAGLMNAAHLMCLNPEPGEIYGEHEFRFA